MARSPREMLRDMLALTREMKLHERHEVLVAEVTSYLAKPEPTQAPPPKRAPEPTPTFVTPPTHEQPRPERIVIKKPEDDKPET